jgi:hypothetical protein
LHSEYRKAASIFKNYCIIEAAKSNLIPQEYYLNKNINSQATYTA